MLCLLPPHHANFNKRLVKAPRLYFYDTGLSCSLPGIREAPHASTHYPRGGLFENLVLAEILKHEALRCPGSGGPGVFLAGQNRARS